MIKVEDYQILQKHLSTLKETSKDDHDTTPKFMTDSLLSVVDFDAVKDEYIQSIGMCETPKSNDALFCDIAGKLIFIEFKNGHMNGKKQHDVRKKVFDSLLIFTDIIKRGISYTRGNVDYILVYNEAKNSDSPEDIDRNVQASSSRDQIAKTLMRKGGRNYIKFGLGIFERYCFSNVYTYTVREFEDEFVAKHSKS